MKKRILALILLVVMALSTTAYAVEPRASAIPGLTFTGTTANCSAVITSASHEIEAVLELWDGSERVDSWEGSGTTYVKIKGNCTVKKGRTYTLTVNGTIDGIAFKEVSVTNTCK